MTGVEGSDSAGVLLGPLQQEVLEFIWDNPGCTVRDCVEGLNARGQKQYAYTTIQTVFDNLHKKHLVSRRRTKTAYHYGARQTRAELVVQ